MGLLRTTIIICRYIDIQQLLNTQFMTLQTSKFKISCFTLQDTDRKIFPEITTRVYSNDLDI